ncbi:hypothetical protein BVG79_00507 [Ketogulonicigenium robustum]|uniref:Uncharacterized protein n=1 Tax=Ketogulonicigenium robustum TaxID=92947 RepID=A0A1W6NXE7_9RHOB|nr:hypothetical protein [Ketogulonicigenium robustum]ARO13859.1 hypothetical protein BVG79_00507 [Ketogulonicigenium robustum]
MRHLKFACGAAALALPLHAHADVYDHVNSALDALPAQVFAGAEPAQFVNLHAISMVFGTADFAPSMAGRASVGLDLPVLQALGNGDSATFADKAGVSPCEVNFFVSLGARPNQAVIWGGEQGMPGAIAASLPAVGFAPIADDVSANGPVGEMNFGAVDAQNPWVGPMGEASLVAVTPTVVYQASSQAALDAVMATPSAYDTPTGQALSKLFAAGGQYVVQGVFFSSAFGRSVAEGGGETVPAYAGGALVDMQGEQGPITLLALVYTDCTTAEAALAAPWPQEVEVPLQTVLAETEGLCIAVTRAGVTDGSQNANRVFDAAYRGMLSRSFAPVAVGGK